MKGIWILTAVMPGKNAAVCDDRLRKALVHEVVAKVNAVAHPLVRNAARKLLVEAKFKINLGIERPIGLVHQPGAPVRILFANHLHFGAPTPTGSVIVPLNFIFADFFENIAHGLLAVGILASFGGHFQEW